MSSNTTKKSANHVKSTIKAINKQNILPFMNILSDDILSMYIDPLSFRERVFSPEITLFGFLAQALNSDKSLQAALSQIIAHFANQDLPIPSANTAAYSQARSRMPLEVISGMAREVAQRLEKVALKLWKHKKLGDRNIKLVDGSTISAPDTPKNQEVYPQPSMQEDGIGFPLMRVVGLFSLTTGAMLDFAAGPYVGKETGEHALFRDLMHNFVSGDIVLGDKYYGSYFCIAKLLSMGVDVVFPQNASRNTDFRKGQSLGIKDHLVNWQKPSKPDWMSAEEYADVADEITLRETVVTFSKKIGASEKLMTLVTTLTSKNITAKDLSDIYGQRWFVELDFRCLKTIMGLDILRSKTPEMLMKEIWAGILAYNLIRTVMAQAAVTHKKNPRKMSFKLALQMILSFRQANLLSSKSKAYLSLLESIVYKEVGNRAGREEPRAVKRRPKPFPRLNKPRSQYKKAA